MILNSCGQEGILGVVDMHKIAGSKIINFSDIEAKHGGTEKGNGFAIQTNTRIMSLTRRQSTGFSVRNNPVAIIGKFILGPMTTGDVPLGDGERILKLTTGPTQNSVFYKFKIMSDDEKKAALREF